MRKMALVPGLLTNMLVLALLLGAGPARAQDPDAFPTGIDRFDFSGLFYLTYEHGEEGGEELSGFRINRSYFTARVKVLPRLSGRITMDAHQDDAGDMKVRLKYAHAKYAFGSVGQIHDLALEAGIAHMVWLDFEEHVDLYRMRDPMFMERSGLFNSADFGLTVSGGFGPSLGEEYEETVNSHYASRYGDFAVGVYNGGGYHAPERNTNKVVEGRLTLRPLPDELPGLQLSGLAIAGKGNRPGEEEELPDWRTYNLFLSYEHRFVTLTAQYLTGEGNQKGTFVEPEDPSRATDVSGYSFFGEAKLPTGWRVIGGYDRFERTPGDEDLSFDRLFAGLGYDLGDQNVLILDFDWRDFDAAGLESDIRYQAILQLKF